MGRVILVGITRTDDDGVEAHEQYVGRAEVEDQETYCLVTLACSDGETRSYPFDARSITRAERGEYRLRSTGEVVVNPDFLMHWTVSKD